MSFNRKYISLAVDKVKERQSRNQELQSERKYEIMQKIPEYAKLTLRLADTMKTVVSLVALKDPDAVEKARKAADDNIAAQKQIKELLVKNGYPADYLEPIYSCAVCRDTGTVNGDWCSCVRRIACSLAAEDLNRKSPLQLCSFDSFDLSLYSSKPDSVFKRPQNEIMKDNLEVCKEFAENPGNGLFMIGPTGLGKTHLSLAAANRLIEKGMSVVYNSVPDLLRIISGEQFNRTEGDTLSVVNDCDLLILDDLGAENISDYNTSLLYQIINARISCRRSLIVNTNLSMKDIKSLYQDRITSRLLSLRVLFFCGDDNRLKTAKR